MLFKKGLCEALWSVKNKINADISNIGLDLQKYVIMFIISKNI